MKIMIIDDERLAMNSLVKEINRIDPDGECTGFTTAKSALAHLEQNLVDIAFLDIEMPEMNGLELAKRIKEINPKTNIVFITGHSQYSLEAHGLFVSGFLLKPATTEKITEAIENLRNPIQPSTARIRIHTFGNFEVFIDNNPAHFGRSKSKELLAYLVDRRGASASTRECFSVLWEDKEYNLTQERYFQMIVSDMLSTLRKANAQDIIIKKRNSLAVDTTKFDCDYYRFLKKDLSAINSFCGEYMAQYSWAEFTTGYLETARI